MSARSYAAARNVPEATFPGATLPRRRYLMIPYPRNEDIVYREDIFHELKCMLPVSSQHQSAALWGLGGSGKTQIALEFAYRRYESTSCPVFWVQADSYKSFFYDYKAIANVAEISTKLESEDLMRAVRYWIETLPDWFLVLDNADNLQYFDNGYGSTSIAEPMNLYPFVPQGVNGTILWTSRDANIAGGLVSPNRGVNVGMMSSLDARNLLENLSNTSITPDDLPSSNELLESLGNLPLAISQAATYMRRTSTSIQRYVEKLKGEKGRWKLLAQSRLDRYRRPNASNSVMETWQISMDRICHEIPCAYKVMHTIAYFDSQNIPFELIKAAVRSENRQKKEKEKTIDKDSDDDDGDGGDDEALEAATRLKEFSFLRLQNEGVRSYEMHKLVQEATRYALNQKNHERFSFSKRALDIMLDKFPMSDYSTWAQCELYLPHAIAVSSWPEVSLEKITVSKLLSKVSRYLSDQGRPRVKESLAKKALKLRQEELGDKHPDTLSSMADLALAYVGQGLSSKAEQIYADVLNLRLEVLGKTHPDTISSMVNMAVVYTQQGRLVEAKTVYFNVFNLSETVLGKRHPSTLSRMADLALASLREGSSSEAGQICREVLALRQEVLGDEHPDTLSSMSDLASTYLQQGQLLDAEYIYAEVLELREELLGDEHPDTLSSMSDLASTYFKQARLLDAEKMYVEVFELSERVLGKRHPDTISSMADLASLYLKQGRSSEAEDISGEVLLLRRKVLGEMHPDTISSRAHLTGLVGDDRVLEIINQESVLHVGTVDKSKQTDQQGRIERPVSGHQSDLTLGLQSLPQPLHYVLAPFLKNEIFRKQVEQRYSELERNTSLCQKSCLELLHEMGSIGETDNEEHHIPQSTTSGWAGTLPSSTSGGHDGAKQGGASSNSSSTSKMLSSPEVGLATDVQTQLPPQQSLEKFFDWLSLHSRTLPGKEDIVERKYLAVLAIYDKVKVNVGAQGVSIGLEGVPGLLRHFLHKDDYLAFFRSVKRDIWLPNDPTESLSPQMLENLDISLFDTSKFSGFDTRLTSVTYNDGKYGTITLFRVTVENGRLSKIRPLAAMGGVPKIVVQKFGDGIKGSSKTTLSMPNDDVWEATTQWRSGPRRERLEGPKFKPHSRMHSESGIEEILKTALSMDDNSFHSFNATVPQMIAMLHHKTGLIENIESTPVKPSGDWCGVELVKGPDMIGHMNDNPRIIVWAPAKGGWVEENVSWR